MLLADLESSVSRASLADGAREAEERHPQRPTRVAVTPVGRERHDVRVVGGQGDEAVLVDGGAHRSSPAASLELGGRDLDRADVVADVSC